MIKYDNVITKEKVLMVLYNFADHVNIQARMEQDPYCTQLNEESAAKILTKHKKLSSLNGRVIPVDLTSDNGFNEENYDRYYGVGRAKYLIDRFIVAATLEHTI